MRIKSMTATFGKLERAELEPGSGLNLIYAPNEGGKSTWAAFWRAMLYGLDTRDRDRRGHLADKNRYQPWSGLPMEGSVRLEWNGQDITLRRGQKGGAPMAAFSAVYTGTGEPVPGLDGTSCGPLLTGAGREVFDRSAFIGAGGSLTVTAAPELERRIAAIVSSGEEDVSFSQTESRLKEWLNRRRVNRSVGLIPRLEEELRQTREALGSLEEVTADIARLEAERAELESRRAGLAAEREIHRRLAQQELDRRCAQAGAELEEAERALSGLEREFAGYGPLPERERLKSAQGELSYLKFLDGEIKEGEAALEAAEAALDRLLDTPGDPRFSGMTGEEAVRRAGEVRRTWQEDRDKAARLGRGEKAAAGLFLAVFALLLGLQAAFPGAVPVPLGLLGLTVPAALGVWSALQARRRREEAESLLSRWQVRTPEELEAAAQIYAEHCQAAHEAEGRSAVLREALRDRRDRRERGQRELLDFVHTFAPQATNLFGCSAALSRALGFDHELALARERAESCRRRREDLLAQGGRDFTTLELLHPPERTPQETELALTHASGQLDRVNESLNQARGRQRAMGDPAALAARAEELERELERRREEYDALSLALEALREANAQLQARFSPALNRLAGEYMARLTGGRYASLTLDRELEGAAARVGDVLPRSALSLSRGTADQLYLAVRLAVCRLCLPQRPPLVLDDALAAFDDERLGYALELLLELSREQQVLLFTCRRREGELLAGVPGVARLTLE